MSWVCGEVLADASKQAHDDYLRKQVAGDNARKRILSCFSRGTVA
jgi:hypothetical protein